MHPRSSARVEPVDKSSVVEVVPLTAEHLDSLGESELSVFLNDYAFCALRDGVPVAAAGIYDMYWPGRGHAWFARRADDWDWHLWPAVTRAVRGAVDMAISSGRYRRVEMTVYDRDDAAKRWAEHLGFKPEALHQKLMQDGSDGWTYARVA